MYRVSIFNNNLETVIHYPSANSDDPHLSKLPLKEGLSIVNSITFSIYPNNPGYSELFELTTKIKIIDVRDDTIRFTGRVLNISEKMDNDGKIYKDIACEDALAYLTDTKQRGSSFYAETVTDFLTQILGIHNSKVEDSKKIQIGTVNVISNVIHSCNYKTTLAEILEVREVVGGDIRIVERNNILYLDWITSFSNDTLEISLGVNMKDMVVSKDVTSLGTRIIPLGANNLTIESVNGGLDYLEDVTARNIYGVIEKTVEYKDIEDTTTLFNTCAADMSKHTQPSYVLESNALDLSYLTGNKAEQFVVGVNLHIINPYMGVDAIYRVVELDLDLLTPYNPNLKIANKNVTLNDTINDLRKASIQDGGVYNNVQIGRAFGIRVVRSDNNVVTTMNATEGISIQNASKKVFYVDLDGNIVCNDITANNMKAEGGTFNDIKANRGIFDDITANRGTYNDITAKRGTFEDIKVTRGEFTDITAKGGTFDDITATNGFTVEDGDTSCSIGSGGITLTNGSYTSGMYVYQSENVPAIMFDDSVQINKSMTVKHGVDIGGNLQVTGTIHVDGLVRIGSDTLQDLIDDHIRTLVKAESLK